MTTQLRSFDLQNCKLCAVNVKPRLHYGCNQALAGMVLHVREEGFVLELSNVGSVSAQCMYMWVVRGGVV